MTSVESRRKRFFCAKLVLTSLVSMGWAVSGCGKPDTPAVQPAYNVDPRGAASVEVAPDESFPSDEYMRLGMPAADREWSSKDMVQANEVLAKLPMDQANLPRYESERSGTVFARITSPQNLELFQNRSLPLEGRMPMALAYGDASNQILKLYLAAFIRHRVTDSEMVELLGSQLRMSVVNVDLANELFPTLDTNDPAYPIRLQGFEQMKRGLASVVIGALDTLIDRQTYRQTELARLANYIRETFPIIVPFLPPSARAETITRLEKLRDDPSLADFRLAMEELCDELQSIFEGTPAAQVPDAEQHAEGIEWKRFSTSDGICSAEFPRPPTVDSKVAFGIESKRLVLYMEKQDILYMVTFSNISPDTPAGSDEDRLTAIRENLSHLVAPSGKNFQFLSESRITLGSVPGRDLKFAAGESHYFRTKVFLFEDRIYRLIHVTPRSHPEDDVNSKRFMNSLQIETGKAEVKS